MILTFYPGFDCIARGADVGRVVIHLLPTTGIIRGEPLSLASFAAYVSLKFDLIEPTAFVLLPRLNAQELLAATLGGVFHARMRTADGVIRTQIIWTSYRDVRAVLPLFRKVVCQG